MQSETYRCLSYDRQRRSTWHVGDASDEKNVIKNWSMSFVKRNYFDVGTFTQADGTEERVFLRARSHHQEKERLALQHIQQIQAIPVPRFLGMIQKEREPGTILLQSYVQGVDLATLLPTDGRPPSPVAYRYVPIGVPTLIPPIRELGKAVAHLHAIKTEQFGDLLPASMIERNG